MSLRLPAAGAEEGSVAGRRGPAGHRVAMAVLRRGGWCQQSGEKCHSATGAARDARLPWRCFWKDAERGDGMEGGTGSCSREIARWVGAVDGGERWAKALLVQEPAPG